jgi:hypothetical protein
MKLNTILVAAASLALTAAVAIVPKHASLVESGAEAEATTHWLDHDQYE